MTKKKVFSVVFLVSLLLGSIYVYRLVLGRPFNIDHFADRTLILFASQHPEILTYIGAVENTVFDFHSDRLTNLSPSAQAKSIAAHRRQNEIFQGYRRSELKGQQRVTYDVLEASMLVDDRLHQFPFHFDNLTYVGPYPANTMNGLQVLPLDTLNDLQQVVDRKSADRYLARTIAIAPYLATLEAAVSFRAELGVIPPGIIMEKLIKQAHALVTTPLSKWTISNTFNKHLENLELDADEVDVYQAKMQDALVDRVIPAYESYLNFLLVLSELDGTRLGVFFVNLRDAKNVERHGMLTLAAHEGIPGHHFESVAKQSLTNMPEYRKLAFNTAYAEGWALYAERLVSEMGRHDTAGELGRAQSEMFRAVRLVVDTGIHAKRWTRQQAIDYMLDYTGMPIVDVTAEIDRYIVLPGQACAYMIGMLEILNMREEAKVRLEDEFDIARFHQVVLGGGNLPLSVLSEQVRKM